MEQITFQTVHHIGALTFDVKALDSFYGGIRICDIFCMTGHVDSLVSRLCVRSLLAPRSGGLASSSVIVIDAGNTSSVYQCVSFARQYGMDVSKVLDGIVVSRAFTIHQLASLVITELPKAVKRFKARIVVISGLLTMFQQDPLVDTREAKRLLEQMMLAVAKSIPDTIVIISAHDIHNYEDIFARFQNRIEVSRSRVSSNSETLQITLKSPYRSKLLTLPEKTLLATGA